MPSTKKSNSITDAQTEAAILSILEKMAEDPIYAIFNHFRTKDEHDTANPVKLFPSLRYLQFLINEWNTGPKLQMVAKSRQLMVSWAFCGYAVWWAMYRPLSLILLQSKKLEDCAPMIFEKSSLGARMSFIIANLPDHLRRCKMPEGWSEPLDVDKMGSYARLTFPNGSIIQGLAQGAAQVEGRVPSLFVSDESSLQDEWESAMAAAKPALDGDARAICVGTMRLPSSYGDCISTCDDVDADAEFRGVARFTTASGAAGLRIHYSADPHKDPATEEGALWKADQLGSGAYAGGEKGWRWQQHMEINPLSRAGTVVLPFFRDIQEQIVIPDIPLNQQYGWSYDAGLDWGARNNTVLLVFGMSPHWKRYLLWELSIPGNECGGIVGICKEILRSPYFPMIEGSISADPSIWNEDQNTTGGLISKAQIFADNGVYLRKAKAKGQHADDVLVDRLNNYYWAGHDQPGFDPKLLICESARNTIKYLPTLMYKEYTEATGGQRQLQETIRDLHVDEWDAFKYAEVYWPEFPEHIAQSQPGTYAWREERYRIQALKGRDGAIWRKSE